MYPLYHFIALPDVRTENPTDYGYEGGEQEVLPDEDDEEDDDEEDEEDDEEDETE